MKTPTVMFVDATGPNPTLFLNTVENMTVAIRDTQKFQPVYRYSFSWITRLGDLLIIRWLINGNITSSPCLAKRKVATEPLSRKNISTLTRSHFSRMVGSSGHFLNRVLFLIFSSCRQLGCVTVVVLVHFCKQRWRWALLCHVRNQWYV